MTAYPSRPDVLARRDARLHRCGGCGGWCYGAQHCGTCDVVLHLRRDVIRELRQGERVAS